MKQCLVLAFVAALAVATIDPETAYVPGKEYVYQYETISTTALRSLTNQIAGLKVKVTARMQIDGQSMVVMKLESPELCKVNQEVPSAETVETVLERSCIPVAGPEADVIISELIKPFSFKWVDGIPTELHAAADEPYWSINIKRGIVNAMQLNLKERNVIEAIAPEIMDMLMPNSPAGLNQLNKVFRGFEKDLAGECETIYSVMEDKVAPAKLHVTKVRNYENCKSKPAFRDGLLSSVNGLFMDIPKKLVKPQSHADYVLAGDRHAFVVKAASIKTHVSVVPFGPKNAETAYTSISQKLSLVSVAPAASPIRLSSHVKTLPALDMYIPVEASSADPAGAIPAAIPAVNAEQVRVYKAEAIKLLNEVAAMVNPEVVAEVPEKVAHIAIILKRLPVASIKEIINAIDFQAADDITIKKKEIILDIIPTLTRTDMVEVIKELIERNIISPARGAVILNMMVLTVKPSPKTFQDIIRVLLPSPVVAQNPMLKKAVLLTTGVLANKIVNMYKEMNIANIPEIQSMAEAIIGVWRGCRTVSEKLDVLAAIGNAGMPQLIPEIEAILADPNCPEIVKAKAVYALKKIAPVAPKKVQSMLFPLYLNPMSPVKVRVAAFLMAIETQPSAGVIQFLAHGIKKDSSVEVVSFVYSYLEAISLSKNPLFDSMAKAAKMALREIPRIRPGVVHSKVISIEGIIKSMGPLGADIRMGLINSGYSPIPDNMFINVASSLFGDYINIAEVAIDSQGLKSLLWNVIGPVNRWEELKNGQIPIQELLLPLTELASKIIGSVDNIKAKFPTQARPMAEAALAISMSLFDYELAADYITAQDMEMLIQQVKPMIPAILSNLQASYAVRVLKTVAILDAAVVMPTPAGLPLTVDATAVGMLSIHGSISMQGLSSIAQILAKPTINVGADIKTSSATTIFGSVGTHLPNIHCMSKVKISVAHKLPVKTQAVVNLAAAKVQVTIDPVPDTMKVLAIKVKPMTAFMKFHVNPTAQACELEEAAVTSTPVVEKVYGAYGAAIGIPIKIKTKASAVFDILKPETFLFCPSEFEVIYEGAGITPTAYEIEAALYGPSATPVTAPVPAPAEASSWWPSYRTGARAVADVSAMEFEPIQPKPAVSMATKREAVVVVSGGPAAKVVKVKVAHLCDPTLLTHQINVQAIASPLLAEQTQPIKVVVDSVVAVPAFVKDFAASAAAGRAQQHICETKISYGFTNTVEELATQKVSWTREPAPAMYNTVARTVSKAPITLTKLVPEMYRGASAVQGFLNAILHKKKFHGQAPSMPLTIAAEIAYVDAKVPEWAKTYLSTMFIWNLQAVNALGKQVIVVPAANAAQKITVQAIIDPIIEEVAVQVMMPTKDVIVAGIPLPAPFLFEEYIKTPALPKMMTKIMHGDIPAGWCAVTPNNYVHAFDLLSAPLPESNCEFVLVKDCSALNLFIVTAKKVPQTGLKIVKILVPNKEVEVIPTGADWQNAAIQVKIDGVVRPVSAGQSVEILDPATNEVAIKVIKKTNAVVVIAPKLGLIVESDASSVTATMSALFRGQTCGVCGDSNGDMFNELRGPHMELYSSAEQFIQSYFIPGAGCEAIPSVQVASSNPSYYSVQSAACKQASRNVILPVRTINGQDKICISKQPVAHCSRNCIPQNMAAASIPFHCLPVAQAQGIRAQAETEPIQLTYQSTDLWQVVDIPAHCTPMN